MNKDRIKRQKAFLGAVVGAATSIIGGISAKKAAKKQLEAQQRQQNKNDTYQMAQNLTAGYSDTEYADELKDRISFKRGGKVKAKGDRIAVAKKFRCGGRKKAEQGGNFSNKTEEGGSLFGKPFGDIGSGISAIGGAIGSAISNSVDTTIKSSGPIVQFQPKQGLETPDYIKDNDNRMIQRCGGKRKIKH